MTTTCALCGRPLGVRIEAHHLIPKSFRGRETVALHPICHRKIHTVLSERELQRRFHTIEALRGHEEIARFIAWIANKEPNFHVATRASKALDGKRRR